MEKYPKFSKKEYLISRRTNYQFCYNCDLFDLDVILGYLVSINYPQHNYSQPIHNHTYHELHMVLKGSCQFETNDGKSFVLNQGDFILFPPAVKHKISKEDDSFSKFVITFNFTPKKTHRTNFYQIAEKKVLETSILPVDEKMISHFMTMMNLSQEKPNEYQLSMFFSAMSFIIDAFRVVVGNEKILTNVTHRDARINSAIEYIKTNISATLKVPDVANYLHMSTRQFTQIFTKEVGTPPGTYIKEYRIKHATDLLINLDLTIDDIVDIMNYPDSTAFIKAFKRAQGTTPAKYKKSFPYR